MNIQVQIDGIGLSREQFSERVMQWEKKKVKGDLICNVCGEHSWLLSSQLGVVPTIEPDNKGAAPLGVGKYVVLVCSNCGNSHSIVASFITGEQIAVKKMPPSTKV